MALTLKCDTAASPKIDYKTVAQAKDMLLGRLQGIGADGPWIMYPTQQCRMKPKPLMFKPVGKGLISCTISVAGDSTWVYHIRPPQAYDLNEVYRLLAGINEDTPEPKVEAEEEDTRGFGIGKIYDSVVTGAINHGVYVQVAGAKGSIKGFVPLAELSAQYDSKAVKKLALGDKFKVMLTQTDTSPWGFSKRSADVYIKEHQNEFTSMPAADGMLSLDGYCDDIVRVYEILGWIANAQMEYGEQTAIQKDALATYIENRFKNQNPAVTKVNKLALHNIFRALAGDRYEFLEVVKVDGQVMGYRLTHTGFREAASAVTVRHAAPKPESADTLLPAAPATSTASAVVKEPEKVPFEDTSTAQELFAGVLEFITDFVPADLDREAKTAEINVCMKYVYSRLAGMGQLTGARDQFLAGHNNEMRELSKLIEDIAEVTKFKRKISMHLDELDKSIGTLNKRVGWILDHNKAAMVGVQELIPSMVLEVKKLV
jgi:hypothetical protein